MIFKRKYKENLESLIEKSNYIQSFCVNKEKILENGFVIWEHSNPLKDFSISDNIKSRIKEFDKSLWNYGNNIVSNYYTFTHDNVFFDKEILPPWIVFPLYDGQCIGWRMGTGEAYMETYISFIRQLSEEDYNDYCKKYPEPEYLKTNCFNINLINHKLRSE